jgi:tetratricopeptide (TPR) repeat protein
MNRKEFIISELINNPQDPFNQYLLALEYLKENNRGEAISLFNNIYEYSPNYLPLYYTYAINLIELGDVVKAKDIVKKGIELAILLNKEKVKSELNQLFELYFD